MPRPDMSGQLRRIDENVQRLVDTDRDHEQRLRVLEARPDPTAKLTEIAATLRGIERWRWIVSGAYLAGGGGLGAAVTLLLGGGGAS